jgi:ferrochelatase
MEKLFKSVPWIWGFTVSAENWNGRVAMLGFTIVLLIELLTGNPILKLLGFF